MLVILNGAFKEALQRERQKEKDRDSYTVDFFSADTRHSGVTT